MATEFDGIGLNSQPESEMRQEISREAYDRQTRQTSIPCEDTNFKILS